MNTKRTRRTGLAATAVLAIVGLAACGGDGSGSANGDSGEPLTTVSFWDPYPQYDDSSDWAKYVEGCAPEGTTLERTTAPNGDLLNSLTSAVREDNAPDVVLLDNPAVPDAAASGLLASSDDVDFEIGDADENLAGPGLIDGKTYGVPIGANTLGLYYNADVLKAAGVDPASITDWASLNDALAAVTDNGNSGITFAGIAGEEGTFQFLPWFWGAGASLTDPGSSEAVEAGQLLSDWIGDGYAPKSAISDNQSASWDLFLTGGYGFAVNGSWFAKSAADLDFDAVMMPIPAKDGGAAPVPTGGEFAVAPIHQSNAQARYDAANEIIDCLVGNGNQVETDDQLGYFAANGEERQTQIDADAVWTPWTDAINNAQGRTSDLGADYTATSGALSAAEQAALNAAGDEDAVAQAFEEAGQSVGQ
ncbi:sugar ABC transporter substrate-binding protein [Nocardioides bruguierae]|uniref:sugar ABC transporter substrate-binding protein n=1 Tax=Nocardioides bruguierae TaxID=2945102 RepID=UPI0020228021|nr:extracellular solute-binding protein [Nocardioides bruguierae]MCL8026921.1 extracellular solute-binding protein [Nocardioides bruguierae]